MGMWIYYKDRHSFNKWWRWCKADPQITLRALLLDITDGYSYSFCSHAKFHVSVALISSLSFPVINDGKQKGWYTKNVINVINMHTQYHRNDWLQTISMTKIRLRLSGKTLERKMILFNEKTVDYRRDVCLWNALLVIITLSMFFSSSHLMWPHIFLVFHHRQRFLATEQQRDSSCHFSLQSSFPWTLCRSQR